MATNSKTPTPSKDVDIFGKELGLTDTERQLLGEGCEVFLKKVLQVDTHSKKGEPTEPKTLVISSSRCLILSHRPSLKLETSFNFLKIHHLECRESKLVFHLSSDPRPREFHVNKTDVVEITSLITAQLKNVFPITPLEIITKLTFEPKSLQEEVEQLRKSLLTAMEQLDASTVPGFITTYGFLCDFFGVPFSEEVSWYMKNVYRAHGLRDLQLAHFDHLSVRELLPVLSTLRHNEFFEGVVERDGKMFLDLFEELSFVLNVSRALKKLVLRNCGLRPDNLMKLCVALKSNPKSALTHLDISDNNLDDRAIESLGAALEALPHGLSALNLAGCKITPRGGSLLANCMKQNKNMQYSLVNLDLSGNPLGPDPQAALTFIQEPNTIAVLDLSKCGINFEFLLPVLNRGCQQHLRELNLAQNMARPRKGVAPTSIGSGLQQFCSSVISIATIDLTDCKLSSDIVVGMLEGLGVNPNITAVELKLASNDLGQGRDPQNLATVFSRTACLHRLDISDCGLDNILPEFVQQLAANPAIRHLAIGRNFNGKANVRAQALACLASFLSREDCQLESLCLNESRLKEQTTVVLNAVATNTSLATLNISGNQMQNRGARCLAKALLTNSKLKEVMWDHNETTLCGFQDVVNSLEHNCTLRTMPLPLFDIGRAGRDPSIEEALQKIQVLLCRNHSDERLKVELSARHRQRLLTTTQQSAVLGREVVQLEDLVRWAEKAHGPSHKDVTAACEVKDQANSVVKLTDGLYSPHVEAEQFEAIQGQVRSVLDSFMEKLFKEHVQESSERMVSQSIKACPQLLSEETLRQFVVAEMGEDYLEAKKVVGHKMAPEIISRISSINLDVAAHISELVTDRILEKLERSSHRLLKLQKESMTGGSTPEQRVSRNFTFRVQGDDSPRNRKKRKRRPDSDEIALPTDPLETDGPALEHLGKTRPKPARLQRGGRRVTVKAAMEPVEETTAQTEQSDGPQNDKPENEKLQENNVEKLEEKPEEEVKEKPEEKLPEKVEKVEEKPEEKLPEKVQEKPGEKLPEKVEKKPEEKLPEKVEKVEEKPEEKLPEKLEEKLEEKQEEKQEKKKEEAVKQREEPEERLEDKPKQQPGDSGMEKCEKKPEEEQKENKEEKVGEEKLQEQPAGKVGETLVEKPTAEEEAVLKEKLELDPQKTDQPEKVQTSPAKEEEENRAVSPQTNTLAPSPLPEPSLVSSVESHATSRELSSPSEEPPVSEKSPETETSTSTEGTPSKDVSKKKSKKVKKQDKVVSPSISPEPTVTSKERAKEKRRSGFSKIFSRSKPKEEGTGRLTPDLGKEQKEEPPAEPQPEVKVEPEVVVQLPPAEVVHRTPPPVKHKPRRAKSIEVEERERPTVDEGERRPPVGVAGPMSDLANVLKKGIATPLKPRPPPSDGTSPVAARPAPSSTDSTPPIVAKKPDRPKPKPKPRVKKAATSDGLETLIAESSVSLESSKSPEVEEQENGKPTEAQHDSKTDGSKDGEDSTLDTLV